MFSFASPLAARPDRRMILSSDLLIPVLSTPCESYANTLKTGLPSAGVPHRTGSGR